MRIIILAVTFSLLGFSTSVVAQHSGTEQEQKACSRDVARYCRKIIDQGDFAILACLQQNRKKLTAACNKVLIEHGQ